MLNLNWLCILILAIACVNGSPTSEVYDAIVIGMGASGTAAAAKLAEAGKKVLALEAQNRIGGRVYTVPFGDDTVEMGAEWIQGTENSPTYELALKNNVNVTEQVVEIIAFRSDGSRDKEDLILELNEVAKEAYDNPPKDKSMPVGEYITGKVMDFLKEKHPEVLNDKDFISNVLEYLDVYIGSYDATNSWNDATIQTTNEDLGGIQAMSWHTYGYKTLFDILLNKYKNGPGYPTLTIKLNTEVTKIQWPQDPKDNVIVTTADGSTYTGKHVIITVSVGVLKERYNTLFEPVLPESKVNAIKSISMGVSSKIILRFSTIWWPENTLSLLVWKDEDKASLAEEDRWLLRVNIPGSPMSSKTSLTLWSSGEAAKKIETLSDEVVKTKTMWLLRKFMGAGKTIPEPVEMIKTSWYSNPYTRGTYSYDNLDLPLHPTVRTELSAPLTDSAGVPRVLFAGEATEPKHFGTVHGAVETGRREANRILSIGSQ